MKNNHSFACPNCGEMLSANARVCRHCGSDENTGWSDNTYLDGIDLPFDDDEYEAAKAREFGGTPVNKNHSVIGFLTNWKMTIGAVVLAAMMFAFVFRGC